MLPYRSEFRPIQRNSCNGSNLFLKKSQNILDHMGSTELAANLFRATQTEEKLIREKIQGKTKANETHFEVGLSLIHI